MNVIDNNAAASLQKEWGGGIVCTQKNVTTTHIFYYIFIIFVFLVGSNELFGQNINLSLRNAKLPFVFKEIEKQCGYSFVYTREHITLMKPVSVSLQNADINTVLNMIFKNQMVGFTITGNYIVVKEKTLSTALQNKNNTSNQDVGLINHTATVQVISGVVNNDKGAPLEGAIVIEKGTTNKTLTNSKGEFNINVKDLKAVLVVSYVGYNEQLVVLKNKSALHLTLNPLSLDEVIIIGYGEVKKSDLTGAVAKVSGKDNEEHPHSTIEQTLQGKVAGVQITQNTGGLAGGMTFAIRGNTSITGSNQPLIVLDGYPILAGSVSPTTGLDGTTAAFPPENILTTLNPNDIQSVEVLKDASSTAIYGSRGANGVVLITTKRGKAGKDVVNYNYRQDFTSLNKEIPVLSSTQFMLYSNEASPNKILYPQTSFNKYLNVNTNWQDLIFQNGISQNHQLSVSGGDQRLRYSLMAGYLEQTGIVKQTRYRRGTLRFNFDRKANDKFSYGINIAGTMSLNKAIGQSSTAGAVDASVVNIALRNPPIAVPFTQDGDLYQANNFYNPLSLVEKGNDENRVLLANLSAFSEYKIFDALRFSFRAGINTTSALRNFYWPTGTAVGNIVKGQAYQGNTTSIDYLTESTLSYNKVLGKHHFNAVTGYTYQNSITRTGGMTVTGFPNDQLGYTNFSAATNFFKPVNAIGETGLASYLFRVNYSYNSKYLFTVTARYEGSTMLATGHQWALFPAVAAGWNLHKEDFMKAIPQISQLKLRASYGQSGNQSVGNGASQNRYVIGTGVVGQTVTTAYSIATIANPLIGWESTSQWNAGVDIGILKDRFTLNIDLYRKLTYDLLINVNIAPSSGFGNYNTNLGATENKGIELSANCKLLTGKLRWTLAGNIAFNANKVVTFNNAVSGILGRSFGPINGQSLNIALPGQPIGAFYGYKVIGIYQTPEEVANYSAGAGKSIGAQAGSFKIADLNGDGIITPDDRTVIGNPYPNYFFGITNTLIWKRLSLNVLIYGSIGQQVANVNRYYLDALNRSNGTNVSAQAYNNRWTGIGTSNKYPKALSSGLPFYGFFTDFIVEDASYVRLKSVTIAYEIKQPANRFVKNFKLFVSGTNLLTITKYIGYDPEINSSGANALTQGIDNGSIPQYKTISAGISMTL